MPLKEKNDKASCGESDWGKWAEKLQKLSFLAFRKLPSLDRQWTKIADKWFVLKKTFT